MEIPRENGEAGKDLIVSHVYKYSEAWNRGLKENQKILKVNEEKVEDIQGLKDLISRQITKNGSIMLEVVNEENATGYIELERN